MSFSFEITRERRLALIRADGPTDLLACKSAVTALVSNPYFRSHYGVLVDLRQMELLSTPDFRDFASFLGQRREFFEHKIALVVSSAFFYGLGKLTAANAAREGLKVSVFHDLDQATQWLEQAEG